MSKKLAFILGATIALSACSNAKTADEIGASYVPTGKYERMSCNALRMEERDAENEVAELTAALQKSYQDDKAAEVIGWILFAPALLLMDGNSDEQKDFGEAKGRLLAIQDTMGTKGCA